MNLTTTKTVECNNFSVCLVTLTLNIYLQKNKF